MSGKINLKITTLTPVTIGSGSELSPYSDYVIDNGQVCFIDIKKMQDKILHKGESYFDKYVQGVAMKIDNNRSEFDLKSFLTNNQIIKDISEVISYRCPLEGKTQSKLPIKGLLKSPLQEPYIAGSTIKGALKTILMYNWLKTDKQANIKIEEVINGKVDNFGKLKDLSFDWLEKQFETFINGQNELVRLNTIQQITDSTRIAKENIVVVDCFRKMPIRFECIAKNKSAEFELDLGQFEWEELAKQANEYVEDALDREFSLVDDDEKMNGYHNYLVEIEEKILNAEKNTAYLRIGFGKGYYLNSLGIAIYDYVCQEGKENLYDKYEEFINKNFARKDKYGNIQEIDLEEFPKTRLFVTSTQEPLGWVKIERI